MARPKWPLLSAALLLAACSQGGPGAVFNTMRADPYPLDSLTREANPGDPCPEVAITAYAGENLPYRPSLKVALPFVARLAQFEAVVTRVSMATYGRAPSAVRHAGAYQCRPIRARSVRWSEHAFGNAIDVVGFDFARVNKPKGDAGVCIDASHGQAQMAALVCGAPARRLLPGRARRRLQHHACR